MATADVERLLDEWALAWSSAEQNDPERVLALFAARHWAAIEWVMSGTHQGAV